MSSYNWILVVCVIIFVFVIGVIVGSSDAIPMNRPKGQIVVDFDAEAPLTMKMAVGVSELLETKRIVLEVDVNWDSLEFK